MKNATNGNGTHRAGADLKLDFPRSEFVQSLQRGLAVIRSFDEQHPVRTLSEVAQAVGITRAATRRFLLTLQALGYVESNGRYFKLRPQTLELGYAYLASTPWWRYAQRVTESVGRELGHACAVGVLDRDAVAYVAYASGKETPQLVRSVGTRLPAYATAIGRALLAGLLDAELDAYLKETKLVPLTPFATTSRPELRAALMLVKEQRYAIVDQQLEIGLSSIGVPIHDRGGRVIAGISVSVRYPHMKARELERKFLATLKRASQEITSGLAM